MKNLVYKVAVLSSFVLASCHSASDTTTSTPPTGPATTASPNSGASRPVAAPLFVGFRRYRGTVGGQPVTVELVIGPSDDSHGSTVCEGSYSYDRHPAGLLQLRGPRPFTAGQSLSLAEADNDRPGKRTGRWQALQPAGPVLTGTWTSPAGRQLPFSLHEDYFDAQGQVAAVRYEILLEETQVPCQPEREEGESKVAYRARATDAPTGYSREFLHLLGPDTLRPSLRALQCPAPAKRRQQVQQAAEGCIHREETLQVDYNAYGFLAVRDMEEEEALGGIHPSHGASATVYNLRTGQALKLADVFRSGAELELTRLVTQHLEQEEEITTDDLISPSEADSTLAPLPGDGFGMDREGLVFQYSAAEIVPYVYGPLSVAIPYAELLPLLRPDSPVARMLRERGLWPKAKPR